MIMTVRIIDLEACIGCGSCVDVCPCEVLEVKDEKVVIVQPDECVDCGACVDECPNEVLQVEEDEDEEE
jgi:NAD-dependent dihydropyrimidine dehydrogenase PreA subunit